MEIVICILAFAALCSVRPPARDATRPAPSPPHSLQGRIEMLRRLGLHRG